MPFTSLYSGIYDGAMTSNSDKWRFIGTEPPTKDIYSCCGDCGGYWKMVVRKPAHEKWWLGTLGEFQWFRENWECVSGKKNWKWALFVLQRALCRVILSDRLISVFGGDLSLKGPIDHPKKVAKNCQVCIHMFVCIYLYKYTSQALGHEHPSLHDGAVHVL